MAPHIVGTRETVLSLFGSCLASTTSSATSTYTLTGTPTTHSFPFSPSITMPSHAQTSLYISFEGTYPLREGHGDASGAIATTERSPLSIDNPEYAKPGIATTPHAGILPSFASSYQTPTSTESPQRSSGAVNAPAIVIAMSIFAFAGVLLAVLFGISCLRRRLLRKRRSDFDPDSKDELRDEEKTEIQEKDETSESGIHHGAAGDDVRNSQDASLQPSPPRFNQETRDKYNSLPLVLSPPRPFSMSRLPRVASLSLRIGRRPPSIVVPQIPPISQLVIPIQEGAGSESPRLPRDIIRRQCSAQRLGVSQDSVSLASTSTLQLTASTFPSAPAGRLVSFSSILPETGLSRSLTSPLFPLPRTPPPDSDSAVNAAASSWLGGDVSSEPSPILANSDETRFPESYSWEFRCRGLGCFSDTEALRKYGRITSIDFKLVDSSVPLIQVVPAAESLNALATPANNARSHDTVSRIEGKDTTDFLTVEYTPKATKPTQSSPTKLGYLDDVLESTATRTSRLMDDIDATLATRLSRVLDSYYVSDTVSDQLVATEESPCDCNVCEDVDSASAFLDNELSLACGTPSWIGGPPVDEKCETDEESMPEQDGGLRSRPNAESNEGPRTEGDQHCVPPITSDKSGPECLGGIIPPLGRSELRSGDLAQTDRCTIPTADSTPEIDTEAIASLTPRHRETVASRSILKNQGATNPGAHRKEPLNDSRVTWSKSTTSIKKGKDLAHDHLVGGVDDVVAKSQELDSYISPLETEPACASAAAATSTPSPKRESLSKPSYIPIPTSPHQSTSKSKASAGLALEIDELFSSHSSLSNIASSLSSSFLNVLGPHTPSSRNDASTATSPPARFFGSPKKAGKRLSERYAAFIGSSVGNSGKVKGKGNVGMMDRKPLGEITNSVVRPTTPKQVAVGATNTSPKPSWR